MFSPINGIRDDDAALREFDDHTRNLLFQSDDIVIDRLQSFSPPTLYSSFDNVIIQISSSSSQETTENILTKSLENIIFKSTNTKTSYFNMPVVDPPPHNTNKRKDSSATEADNLSPPEKRQKTSQPSLTNSISFPHHSTVSNFFSCSSEGSDESAPQSKRERPIRQRFLDKKDEIVAKAEELNRGPLKPETKPPPKFWSNVARAIDLDPASNSDAAYHCRRVYEEERKVEFPHLSRKIKKKPTPKTMINRVIKPKTLEL